MDSTTSKTAVLLTAKDLAERWHVQVGTLANMRVRGEGPSYVKLGRVVRYKLSAVEAYEAAGTVEVAA